MTYNLTKELFQTLDHFITPIKLHMSKYYSLIEFALTNMITHQRPPIKTNPLIARGLHKEYLIGICFELKDHRHMIEMGPSKCTR